MTILGRARPAAVPVPEPAPPSDAVVEDELGLFQDDPVKDIAAEPPPRRRRTWRLFAVALVAVLLAVVAVQQHLALQADRSLNRQLRDLSGRTVAALTNYDYQHLDAWKESVTANLTGGYRNTFLTTVQGSDQVYVAEHNRATSTVEGVWLGQPSGDTATSVVLVRITVTSLTGTHTIEPYVQLTLVKVGAHWRVDDVRYTIESGTGATPTPSTSAP